MQAFGQKYDVNVIEKSGRRSTVYKILYPRRRSCQPFFFIFFLLYVRWWCCCAFRLPSCAVFIVYGLPFYVFNGGGGTGCHHTLSLQFTKYKNMNNKLYDYKNISTIQQPQQLPYLRKIISRDIKEIPICVCVFPFIFYIKISVFKC